MTEEQFMALVDKDAYQVFVMSTPISFPLQMFVHAYIITNNRGTLTRWDLLHRKSLVDDSVAHVHKNITTPWRGLSYFYFWTLFAFRPSFTPRCHGHLSGGEHSQARDMVVFLQQQAFSYKYRHRYHVLGPNSNTFVQWFLDAHDGHNIRLPKNAIGKNYITKHYETEKNCYL